MKKYMLIIFILVFSGCSFKSDQKDLWKKNVSNSFDSYVTYYLQGDFRLASIELNRAVSCAKNSVDLSPLSKIYLGKCALDISVLRDVECQEYDSIKDMLEIDNDCDNYHYMLQKNFNKVNLKKLPLQYNNFVKAMKNKDYNNAFNAIRKMQKTSSKLVAAALMKEFLGKNEINYIINEASISGYKRAVISWLKFLKEKSSDVEQQKVQKMLDILTN